MRTAPKKTDFVLFRPEPRESGANVLCFRGFISTPISWRISDQLFRSCTIRVSAASLQFRLARAHQLIGFQKFPQALPEFIDRLGGEQIEFRFGTRTK